MSFIQREIDRFNAAIRSGESNREELYAAQQALAWVMEPEGFASPAAMLMGIQEGSKDYSEIPHPLQS